MLTVMSFNLRVISERDAENNWPLRKEVVVDVIEKYNPDIIGTQEGRPEQISYLESALPGYKRIGCGRDIDGGEHVAIFIRNTVDIKEVGDFWLSDTPEKPGSMHWGNKFPRMVTYIVCKEPDSKNKFLMVNTHLDHQSENARQNGAVAIHKFIKQKDLPVILTGDMNAVPSSAPIHFFTGKLELTGEKGELYDTRELMGESDNAYTFHGYGQKESGIIDYVFVSEEFKVNSYNIVTDKPNGKFVSDHYPVVANVSLEK